MRTSQHALLHGLLFAVTAVSALGWALSGGAVSDAGETLVAAAAINLVGMTVASALSRRRRRAAADGWASAAARRGEELRMRRGLEAAREIQLGMLPVSGPDLPWVDAAAVSLPATEVGGDYFDWIVPGPDRLVVVTADVAGHGVASGLMLSGIRSCLALLEDELDRPADVMGRLDLMVRRTTVKRMFVAMALLGIDRVTGEGTLVSAGYPPLLLRRHATGMVEEIGRGDLPLGTPIRSSYRVERFPVRRGDALLTFSDGILEAIDDRGEPFGLGRVVDAFSQVERGADAAQIRDAVTSRVRSHRGAARQVDDVTLVAMIVR